MKYMMMAVGVGLMSATAWAEMPAAKSGDTPAVSAASVETSSSPSKEDNSPAALAWKKITEDFSTLRHAESDPNRMKKVVSSLDAEVKDFVARYPDDENVLDAMSLETQLGGAMMANHWPGAPTEDELDKLYDRLASNEKTSKQQKASIRGMQILGAIHTANVDDAKVWAGIDARIDAFVKEFGADYSLDGKNPVLVTLRANELTALKDANQNERYEALVKKLSTDKSPDMAEMVQAIGAKEKRVDELKSKPLDLKYTAVDGATVDLADMRGKVVLVDFWATWCGPCVAEMPDVVAAYQKYHDKGLAIAGISLDPDKETMISFTKAHGMTWPQYFDGKVWQNDIATTYGVHSIPAMWLIDKKGMLVTMNARDDLNQRIEKLLAQP